MQRDRGAALSGPSRAPQGRGMPLGSIPGREARNGDGSVLIAQPCDHGAEHAYPTPRTERIKRRAIGLHRRVSCANQVRDQRIDRAIEIRPLATKVIPRRSAARDRGWPGWRRNAISRSNSDDVRSTCCPAGP